MNLKLQIQPQPSVGNIPDVNYITIREALPYSGSTTLPGGTYHEQGSLSGSLLFTVGFLSGSNNDTLLYSKSYTFPSSSIEDMGGYSENNISNYILNDIGLTLSS